MNKSLLYQNEDTADIKLVVGDNIILAHKWILSEKSDYFKAMFTIGMIESNQNVIKLDESILNCFELVIQLSYDVSISDEQWDELSLNEIFEAIIIANKYQFIDSEVIISDKLMSKLKLNSPDYITEEINYQINCQMTQKKDKFVSIVDVHEMAKSYHLAYFTHISSIYIEKKAQQVVDSWKSLYNYWW